MLRYSFNCKMYYGDAGSTADTEMDNVKNATLTLQNVEADVTVRAGGGWKLTAGVLHDVSIEFEMQWDTEDEAFQAMKDAWLDRSPIAILVLDAENGEGIDGDFAVINLSRTEQIEDVVRATVTLKPTYADRAPTWVDGSGS